MPTAERCFAFGEFLGDVLAKQVGEGRCLKRGPARRALEQHRAELGRDLERARRRPAPRFVHRRQDVAQERFREVVARHDNVAGVYAGHTHRNNRSLATGTGDVPFFEGGAVKEYPGGFTQVRLFEGGYMVNFFKTDAPDARAWSEVTRGEYLGLAPHYQLGGVGDRNWVHHVDARRTVDAG